MARIISFDHEKMARYGELKSQINEMFKELGVAQNGPGETYDHRVRSKSFFPMLKEIAAKYPNGVMRMVNLMMLLQEAQALEEELGMAGGKQNNK